MNLETGSSGIGGAVNFRKKKIAFRSPIVHHVNDEFFLNINGLDFRITGAFASKTLNPIFMEGTRGRDMDVNPRALDDHNSSKRF